MPSTRARRPPPLSATLLAALALGGCDREKAEETAGTAAEAHAGIDVDDVALCAACHGAVVDEWRTSMHAQAHHDADPIYGAMRAFRMEKQGPGLATKCAQCHGPRDPGHPDGAVARTGVGCAACHAIGAIDTDGGKRKGAGAFTWSSPPVLRGPNDVAADAAAPHGVGPAAPWIADGRTLCLACHGEMRNPQGAPTCQTGAEYAEGAGDTPCTGCHMPEVEGPSGAASTRASHRSHAFLGPHHLWREAGDAGFLAGAVAIEGRLEGGSLVATLRNTTQHAMPTGFPGRLVIVRATGFDAAGDAVWRNFETDPVAEDPDAVLRKVYVDDQGEPTMPPFAARLEADTRLAPGEARDLRWAVPGAVVRAELALVYRLLPPPAAETLGIADTPEAGARTMRTVEVAATTGD